MEAFNNNIKRFLALSGGALFFILLSIHIIWERLALTIKKVFNFPGLYSFRESDFVKIESNQFINSVSIELGELPVKYGKVVEYILPDGLHGYEIFIECSVINDHGDYPLEIDYTVVSNDLTNKEEYFYFFLNSLPDKPDMRFNKAGLWIKRPKDNKILIKCSDIKPANALMELTTKVEIVKFR